MDNKLKEQTDQEAAVPKRPSRKRGTAFPVVSLPETARILREAGKYGFEHHTASFATYMGHSSTNSGAFRQRLAAFRDWELIDGRGDTLTMTEVARRIAMPTDEAAEREALQQAFKNCEVFTGLYEKMAKGQPLDRDGLAAQAVHGFGVSPAKAPQFVRSFVESVLAAHMAATDDQGNVVLLDHGTVEQASGVDVSGDEPGVPDHQEPEIRWRRIPSAVPPLLHHQRFVSRGTLPEVRLSSNSDPSMPFRQRPSGISARSSLALRRLLIPWARVTTRTRLMRAVRRSRGCCASSPAVAHPLLSARPG